MNKYKINLELVVNEDYIISASTQKLAVRKAIEKFNKKNRRIGQFNVIAESSPYNNNRS